MDVEESIDEAIAWFHWTHDSRPSKREIVSSEWDLILDLMVRDADDGEVSYSDLMDEANDILQEYYETYLQGE